MRSGDSTGGNEFLLWAARGPFEPKADASDGPRPIRAAKGGAVYPPISRVDNHHASGRPALCFASDVVPRCAQPDCKRSAHQYPSWGILLHGEHNTKKVTLVPTR